jgi:hypothetical protein
LDAPVRLIAMGWCLHVIAARDAPDLFIPKLHSDDDWCENVDLTAGGLSLNTTNQSMCDTFES